MHGWKKEYEDEISVVYQPKFSSPVYELKDQKIKMFAILLENVAQWHVYINDGVQSFKITTKGGSKKQAQKVAHGLMKEHPSKGTRVGVFGRLTE